VDGPEHDRGHSSEARTAPGLEGAPESVRIGDPAEQATKPRPPSAPEAHTAGSVPPREDPLWLRAIVESGGDAITGVTPDGSIVVWNEGAERTYGYSAHEVIGRNISILDPPSSPGETAANLTRALAGEQVRLYETHRLHKDGTRVAVSLIISPVRDEEGAVIGVFAIGRDLSSEHQALVRSEERFKALVQHSADLIVVLDSEARLVYATPAAKGIMGFDPEEELGRQLLDFVHPEDADRAASVLLDLVTRPGSVGEPAEYRVLHLDGTWRTFEVITTNLLEDPAVRGVVINARDVTELHQAQKELAHRAGHDALTGLANRYLLNDRIVQALARARRDGTRLAVLFLDLDDFKRLNDSMGHASGDIVMREVADRLKAASRESDTVARFGGDEFVIVIEQIGDGNKAREIAERILKSVFEVLFPVGGDTVRLSASIGVALGNGESSSECLLADADTAMYAAKSLGRSRVAVFDENMRSAVATHADNAVTDALPH